MSQPHITLYRSTRFQFAGVNFGAGELPNTLTVAASELPDCTPQPGDRIATCDGTRFRLVGAVPQGELWALTVEDEKDGGA